MLLVINISVNKKENKESPQRKKTKNITTNIPKIEPKFDRFSNKHKNKKQLNLNQKNAFFAEKNKNKCNNWFARLIRKIGSRG